MSEFLGLGCAGEESSSRTLTVDMHPNYAGTEIWRRSWRSSRLLYPQSQDLNPAETNNKQNITSQDFSLRCSTDNWNNVNYQETLRCRLQAVIGANI